ncbi:MAG: hypothetical protein QM391_02350 [Bacillota bacterium]|nr:hypothetical protein [Bacillota bacterium]HPU62071.1 hypothetical protein [Bacillota bacterium]
MDSTVITFFHLDGAIVLCSSVIGLAYYFIIRNDKCSLFASGTSSLGRALPVSGNHSDLSPFAQDFI